MCVCVCVYVYVCVRVCVYIYIFAKWISWYIVLSLNQVAPALYIKGLRPSITRAAGAQVTRSSLELYSYLKDHFSDIEGLLSDNNQQNYLLMSPLFCFQKKQIEMRVRNQFRHKLI